MIRLYCDEDSMDQGLVRALRVRGLDVTTVLDESMIKREDKQHLDYATQQGRVFSFNRSDFHRLHIQHMEQNKSHAGIILANQQQYSVGEQMRRNLRLSAAKTSGDMKNWGVFWGPHRHRRIPTPLPVSIPFIHRGVFRGCANSRRFATLSAILLHFPRLCKPHANPINHISHFAGSLT